MKFDVVRTWKELTDTEMLAVYGGHGPATLTPEAEHQNALGGFVKNVLGAVTETVTNAPVNTFTDTFAPVSSPITNTPVHVHVYDDQRGLQHQLDDQHQLDAQHQHQHQAQEQTATATSTSSGAAPAVDSSTTPSPSGSTAAADPEGAQSGEDAFNGFDS
jgi:hypothetical protein